MRRIHRAAGLLAFPLVLSCSGDSTGPDDGGPDDGGPPAEETQRIYDGTAAITLRYEQSAFGTLNGQAASGTLPVRVVIGPRRSAGGITESNPFTFQISSPQTPAHGEFLFQSAGIASPPSGGGVLLQFWTFGASGGSLSGTLTDTHAAEAAVPNSIFLVTELARNSFLPFPAVVYAGATLAGILDANSFQATIAGRAGGGNSIATFQMQIIASRTS